MLSLVRNLIKICAKDIAHNLSYMIDLDCITLEIIECFSVGHHWLLNTEQQ
jgi:hypothetical protein